MEFYRNLIEPVCFLGSIAVVTMLNFIVPGHGLSFYLFSSSLISLRNVL